MLWTKFLALASLLVTTAVAQTPSPDTQLTQALIHEIRQLRQDLQSTAATIQRVQLMMFRLQAQTALTTRATQRLDDAKARCGQVQFQRKMSADSLDRAEQRARLSQNPIEKKEAEDVQAQIKLQLDTAAMQEQQCQSMQAEAESQFRMEQAKLSDLQDQMDKFDKVLDGYGKK